MTTHRPVPAALALAGALALAACGTPSLKTDQPSLTPPTMDCSAAGVAASDAAVAAAPTLHTVCVLTSQGELVLALDAGPGPVPATATVANFLQYVTEGFYDMTVIHRVSPNFVIQGGGYSTGNLLVTKPNRAAIALESDNGLKNLRGTIAMALVGLADGTTDPSSARSQFFVNLADNPSLDHDPTQVDGSGNPIPNGYAVFGRVISGMSSTVAAIGGLPTYSNGVNGNLPYPMVIVYWAKQLR